MGTNGFGMHSINSLAQNTAEAAVFAKAKLLGGIRPPKKFVPHIPPMGRPQQGKPPYNPPPPPPEPQAAGYAQAGQLPYQQPLGYGPQGMVPPQMPGFAPQSVAGLPQPGMPPMQGTFADPQAFTVKCCLRYACFFFSQPQRRNLNRLDFTSLISQASKNPSKGEKYEISLPVSS